MARYVFNLEGREQERRSMELDSPDMARAEAVRFLGGYLADHPDYVDEHHWRVNVEDDLGRPLLHVIVASVLARNSPLAHGARVEA